MWNKLFGALLCIALFAAVGCNKSSTNTTAVSSTAATASQTLMEQLGGMNGVNQLADNFASNLSQQPAVTKYLNPEAIAAVKSGLVNEVAKASGMAPPNPGADLMQALSGKGLDAGAMTAFSGSLQAAAATQKLGDAPTTALMTLIDPIAKSAVGK
jgi:hypothetical protein